MSNECERKDCKVERTGPFTQANDPNHPTAQLKVPMKCEVCGKEWIQYFFKLS